MSTRPEDIEGPMQRDLQQADNEDITIDMEPHPFLKAVISGATGVVFGIALEKGRVFEPLVIRDQMLFKRFVMMKMFLSASLIGMVCFSLLNSMPQTMLKMRKALQTYIEGLRYKSVVEVAVGGAILGCGMTIAGACPGTVLVQLGAQVPNAWATIAGGLCGAAIYSMTDSALASVFRSKKRLGYYFLDRYLDVSFMKVALPIASLMALVVFGLEYYFPWYTEVPESLVTDGMMHAGAWPPFVTGLIIGTLQIPIVLANQDTLGSASSYVTAVSQIFPLGKYGDAYLSKYRYGMKNWWQVIYVGSAVGGGYLSAMASNTLGTVTGLPWHQSFGGGFLIIYGSRLAGGCTSGHGLSGMGLLALQSFIAVPAMFAGGIGTALFMKHVLQADI